MANYYNITGYRNTGFDPYNLPFSREVFSQPYFTDPNNYFQMNGIAVKRDDLMGLRYIDLPGSVKDLRGSQINAPNSTGTHGPNGPWYKLENVDYLRIARTGYPDDEDFIDISGNMSKPWETGIQVGFYFVTAVEPRARNVTRLYLELDVWTTCSDKLKITNGFKIQGPITDAEDAATFNTSPENIGLIYPMQSTDPKLVSEEFSTTDGSAIVVSPVDLLQYEIGETPYAIIAEAQSGEKETRALIKGINTQTLIALVTEPGEAQPPAYFDNSLGYYNLKSEKVKHNLNLLYSFGQLSLQNCYFVPPQFISGGQLPEDQISRLINSVNFYPSGIDKSFGTYPRKAQYFYRSAVLYNQASGEQNEQPLYNLENENIKIWALLTPGGYPIARFIGIKDCADPYSDIVKGTPWSTKALSLEGASGSVWSNINNSFNLQTQQLNEEKLSTQQKVNNLQLQNKQEDIDLQQNRNSFGIASQIVGLDLLGAAQNLQSSVHQTYTGQRDLNLEAAAQQKQNEYDAQALAQNRRMLEVQAVQSVMASPSLYFSPDINLGNIFGFRFYVYTKKEDPKDNQRLRDYFLRLGYSGLYKPLTMNEINIKQKVNYCRCVNVSVIHPDFPARIINRISEILSRGVFFWNVKPNQSEFNNNPDN